MAKKNNKSVEELLEEAIVKDDVPYEVPVNWVWSKLGQFCNKIQYGYTEKASIEKIGPHFLRITDIQDNHVDWRHVPYCTISEKDYPKYKLDSGDIVIARTGATTGKNYMISEEVDSVFASYLIRVQLSKSIYNKYISYYMYSDLYWNQIIEERIESFFEKLDKSLELIQEAREGFDTRKAAVLEKAYSGELTKKWRETHRSTKNYIFNEINKYYEEKLSKRDFTTVTQLQKESMKVDSINDSVWFKCTIGAISKVSNGSTPSRQQSNYWNGNIPWVSSGEVRNNLSINK